MYLEDQWFRQDRTKKTGHGKGRRWRVTYDDDGVRRRKSFDRKADAQAFISSIDHAQRSGTHISQATSETLVQDLLAQWLDSLIHLKPSTQQELVNTTRNHLEPWFGAHEIQALTRKHLQAWVNDLAARGLAVRTVDTLYGHMRLFLTWCVQEGYLADSPAKAVKLPRGGGREHIILTPEQVNDLIDAMPGDYGLLVEILVRTGLRIGEAAELRVKDLDLPRRRIRVNRAVARGVIGMPKNHKRREVPISQTTADKLAAHIVGKDREDLLFVTTRGNQLQPSNFKYTVFDPAARAAGMPEGLRVHDLRHTCASLVVSAGGNVKLLQQMLGHASATHTLDTYAGVLERDLEGLAANMDTIL